MPVITFTTADVLKNKLLEPKWYPFTISKIDGPTTSKAGDSLNFNFVFRVGQEAGPLAGKEIYRTYNSKAIGMLIPLVAAVRNEEVKPENFSLDTDELLNKSVDGKIVYATYEGNQKNEIAEFAPAGTGKDSATSNVF